MKPQYARHPVLPSSRLTAGIGAGTLNRVDSRPDLAACKACYCLAARSAARSITRLYEARLRPYGLRATQFSILAALALKGVTPMRELADLLGLERTTLTRSAVLLERNGWLRPGRSDDAREHPLELTAAGRGKLEEAFPAWQAVQDLIGRMLADGDEGHSMMGIAGQALDESLLKVLRAPVKTAPNERS